MQIIIKICTEWFILCTETHFCSPPPPKKNSYIFYQGRFALNFSFTVPVKPTLLFTNAKVPSEKCDWLFLENTGLSRSWMFWRLDRKNLCTNLFIFMQFLLILDTVNRPKQKWNQAEQEGCFKECLHRSIAHHAMCVLRGAYLRENVST
jgi:hypothetical protein